MAGRTATPKAQPLATRIGGFGGIEGLAAFLRTQAIVAVIDATHPYAAQISANAVAACRQSGVPLASIGRAAWAPQSGDRWQDVVSAQAAATALGQTPRRVFLSLGRLDLEAFASAVQHDYIARTIDPPRQTNLPPRIRFLQARGPFDLPSELKLLRDEKIDTIVSKNSGGSATYPKIEAARVLGLPVVMIARPDKATGDRLTSAEEAVAWLGRVHDRSLRGV